MMRIIHAEKYIYKNTKDRNGEGINSVIKIHRGSPPMK
jgi:hypothetical protein